MSSPASSPADITNATTALSTMTLQEPASIANLAQVTTTPNDGDVISSNDPTQNETASANDEEDKTTFFDLPAEIRNKIYAFATSSPSKISILKIPAVAQANRQLRAESLPIYYESSTLHIPSPNALARFLPIRDSSTFNTVYIDLSSSVEYGWTLTTYDWHILKIVDECAVWTNQEKGLQLLAKEQLNGFLGLSDLGREVQERVQAAKKEKEKRSGPA